MIQITPHMRIYLCISPIDFRKGIDGLSGVCRNILAKDPFSGSMFIFRNKRKTTLKILVYDGQGFWLFVKRLSSGRFNWWPNPKNEKTSSINITPAQLHLLIWNGNLPDAGTPLTSAPWKNITPADQPSQASTW
jgi:transposase